MGKEIKNVADIISEELERRGLWRESYLVIEHNKPFGRSYVDTVTAKIRGCQEVVATLYSDKTIFLEGNTKNYAPSLKQHYDIKFKDKL